MPPFVNWCLRLGPTNPIATRLVSTGSRREFHLLLRISYLLILMAVLFIALIGEAGTLRAMAQRGAQAFTILSFGQLALICLLTPIFMAGAITQEANPQTWDILLTTPLNALQIVLGNLLGRLFFIITLLLASLPIFLVTQFFGGVPGSAIFLALLVSGCSAFIVAAIAIILSVTRSVGRRAVFIFYLCVILYLIGTYVIDTQLRGPIMAGSSTMSTTIMTPLNPFLALESVLLPDSYAPVSVVGGSWIASFWFGQPILAFSLISFAIGAFLIIFSTLRVRSLGTRESLWPAWLKFLTRRREGQSLAKAPRAVGQNAIAWWEYEGRGRTLGAVIGRWSFVTVGLLVAFVLVGLFVSGSVTVSLFRVILLGLLATETVLILLTALNQSATAVSREREDGTLDLILTTPIQPGPYLAGKLRGLIQNLMPMILVPVATLALTALVVLIQPFGVSGTVSAMSGTNALTLPVVLPESAITFPLLLIGCTAMCVMIGLQWSLRSRSTIGSISSALSVVLVIMLVIGFCGVSSGEGIPVLGSFLASISPINLLLAAIQPSEYLKGSFAEGASVQTTRIALFAGGMLFAFVYVLVVFFMHSSMKKSFMMTVRRLAGTS